MQILDDYCIHHGVDRQAKRNHKLIGRAVQFKAILNNTRPALQNLQQTSTSNGFLKECQDNLCVVPLPASENAPLFCKGKKTKIPKISDFSLSVVATPGTSAWLSADGKSEFMRDTLSIKYSYQEAHLFQETCLTGVRFFFI